jgi:hypothetical protein
VAPFPPGSSMAPPAADLGCEPSAQAYQKALSEARDTRESVSSLCQNIPIDESPINCVRQVNGLECMRDRLTEWAEVLEKGGCKVPRPDSRKPGGPECDPKL